MNGLILVVRLVLSAALLFIAACSPSKSPTVEAKDQAVHLKPAASSKSIDWFSGTVSDAFAHARDSDKPVFLYWGAVWCPPCNVIKSTVFTQPEFIQQTKDFIAVYLDGDSEDAQRWGEHFGAMGYPTMIVFDSSGEELTRLSSGMELGRYREVLQLSQKSGQAVKQLAQQVLDKPKSLSADDWNLLAWYSWPADQGRVVAEPNKQAFFQHLAQYSPEPLLAQRFALLAALSRLQQEASLQPEEQQALLSLLQEVLTQEQAWQLNLDELQYQGMHLIQAASADDTAEFQRLGALYVQIMEKSWANEALALKPRLNSLYGLADWALAQGGKPTEEIQQRFLQRVNWLRQQQLSPQARQSMMAGAADMLHELGLSNEARKIFQQELKQSVAPYYYMAYLAGLEKDLGHKEAALDWSRRAWQQAEGPATRIQWGLAHLGRLLELEPSAGAEVIQVLEQVFDTLHEHPGAFYQRSRVRLQRALPKVRQWLNSASHPQDLSQLGSTLSKVCHALEQGTASAQLCDEWQSLVTG